MLRRGRQVVSPLPARRRKLTADSPTRVRERAHRLADEASTPGADRAAILAALKPARSSVRKGAHR